MTTDGAQQSRDLRVRAVATARSGPRHWIWLVAGGMALAIFIPVLDMSPYLAGLLVQAYLFAILAVATDLVWGYTGILSFASAAMFGIGAYAVGIMFVHVSSAPWSIAVALIGGVAVAAALSLLIGWLAFYSRIQLSEFYITIVTLGISVLFSQTVSYGGWLTGGSNGLSGFRTVAISVFTWYAIAGLALILASVAALVPANNDFGLVLRAIHDHEMRCRYIGIRTPWVKTLVFTAANCVAAVAGVLYGLFATVVAPSLAGIVLATNVLIWVMLGGRGTIIGPVVAAVAINAVTPELNISMPFYWQGALGLLFIIVVVLLPRGLFPELWLLVQRLWGRAGVSRRAPRPSVEILAASPDRSGSAASSMGAEVDAANPPVLEAANVSKQFGSFHALTDVSFNIRKGELVSIVGPNGAGKTSLVRCISDGLERSSGTVIISGHPIGRSAPDAVVRFGAGRKFQGASVFESLTVGECLNIASWKGDLPSPWRRNMEISLPGEAAEVIVGLGLGELWNERARDLSYGARQALELAMVLALEPQLIILDEPTAGLAREQRAAIGKLLQRLVSTGRLAVLLIEHDFDFVKEISTRIIVLHEGRLIADGNVAEVASLEVVNEIYVGRAATEVSS